MNESRPPIVDNASDRKGPLAGVRVVDASTVLAGPLACQILGDFGAHVIKVEHPNGDPMRTHGYAKNNAGLWWKMLGRNKRCVGIYLGDPEGAAIFKELVRTADIVIENFRPGTFERWGLGFDQLKEANPNVILVRISGFGQKGPYSKRPGFGTMVEAMSGLAAITGPADGPPILPTFGLADSIAALAAVNGALLALHHRIANGGAGQEIDVSLLEPLVTALGPQVVFYDQLGVIQKRNGNRSINNAPRNAYETRDGKWIAISASSNRVAERLLRLVGHPEVISEPWFSHGRGRVEHVDLLDEYVGSWIKERTADEAMRECAAAEVAAAVIYDVADLMRDPHVQELGMIATVQDEDLGEMRMQNVLLRMSETPGAIRWTGRSIGADTDEVLGRELGIDPERIEQLRSKGIVA